MADLSAGWCAHLDMEPIVLEDHHQRPREPPRQLALALEEFSVQLREALPHPVAVRKDLAERGPILVLLRHLRVRMAVLGVVHMLVDTPFEDRCEAHRLHGALAQVLRHEQVEEGREVAQVEERLVSQVDRLAVQERGRDHPQRDEVPDAPAVLELGEGGHVVWAARRVERRARGEREAREGDGGALEHVKDE